MWQLTQVLHVNDVKSGCLQEDVRSIEAGSIPMPKYANSQAAFYAVQQAPPPMPMPPPIPIETSATVSNLASSFDMPSGIKKIWLPLSPGHSLCVLRTLGWVN